MRYNPVKSILLGILLTAGVVFAVTDQEVQQIQQAMPDKPVVQPVKPRTMLVFSLCNGYKHSSIPYWKTALDVMSEKTGAFKVVHSEDMSVFTPESLSRFDVICFNNTTGLVPDENQQKAIMDFITSGKGIVGIHAATDNFNQWPAGMEMMGGVFKGHPWGGGGTWAIKIDDPDHPLMKSFHGKGFKIKDEIYRTAPPLYSRDKQRVLMSLDMSDPTTRNADGVEPDDMDTGISWIKRVGGGRLFYCSLGHDHAVTWNPAVLAHYLAGIQYAMGDLKVDDTPIGAGSQPLDVSALDNLIKQLDDYDWNKSRAALIQIQALIRSHFGDKKACGTIEDKLLAKLNTDVSPAAKDFICRQLAVIGTEKSVPLLSRMLVDPKTTNIARYALEKVPGPAVDDVFVKTAKAAKDNDVLIGILTTLGHRKSERVVSLSREIFSTAAKNDEPVSTAFFGALGMVGTEASADELLRLKSGLSDSLQARCDDALLMCADALRQSGKNQQAVAIYQKVYRAESPDFVRAAALLGLAKSGAADVQPLLSKAMQGSDVKVRTAAIEALAYIDNNSFLKSIAADASTLPQTARIQVLSVLSDKSQEAGRAMALQMAKSDQPSMRVAAYQALAKTGEASDIDVLATAAGMAPDRDERAAAQEALYRMPGKEIDAAILKKLADSVNGGLDGKVVAELINATVNRQIADAPTVLFRTAASDNRQISTESIRAIQSLAGPEYAGDMVDLVIAKPGTSTENALIVMAEKMPSRDRLVTMIQDKYAKISGNDDAKASLLRVLGKLGDPGAIGLLKREYASSNEKLSDAAFRAMTDWPGTEFVGEMKTLAQSGADAKTKILAFRAYVRMVKEANADNQQQTVSALIAAYPLAERADEQKIVIGMLGDFGNVKALQFVKDKLNDPALKAEAAVSLMQICEKLLMRNPSAVVPVLQELKKDGASDAIRNKADELLNKVTNMEGYVFDWQVSGPYMEDGKSGELLFDVAFGPEKDLNSGQWKDAQSLLTGDNPPIFDLTGVGNGDNRVAYLKTVLSVDKTTPVILHIGSDDGVKVWVNGKQVHANNAGRPLNPGQDKANVTLEKGQNPVLVKITQRSGNWSFCMKVTDPDNNPVSGLQVDAGN